MKRRIEELLFIVAVTAIVVGLAMIYRPLAWIGGGVMLAVMLIFSRLGETR